MESSSNIEEHRFFADYKILAELSGGFVIGLDLGFQVPDIQPRIGASLSYSFGAVGGGSRRLSPDPDDSRSVLGRLFGR